MEPVTSKTAAVVGAYCSWLENKSPFIVVLE